MVSNALDVQQLAMLASLFVPLLVNLLTKQAASDGVKAVVNIVASAVVATLAIWIDPSGQPVTVWLVVNTFLASVAASFVAYKAVWKPLGASALVASKTANFGLGAAPAPVREALVVDEYQGKHGMTDLDGDGIPDELEVGDLEDLIAATPTEIEGEK